MEWKLTRKPFITLGLICATTGFHYVLHGIPKGGLRSKGDR